VLSDSRVETRSSSGSTLVPGGLFKASLASYFSSAFIFASALNLVKYFGVLP